MKSQFTHPMTETVNHRQNPPREICLGKASRAGFSLVEVALAIAILAFAMIPLIALLPHGQDTLRLSIREAAESRIEQELLGRLASTDWSTTNNLDTLNDSLWYFNDYGLPVESPTDALFTAQLEFANNALPGASNKNDFLKTVVIKITDLPATLHPFDNANRYRRFVATVAKMDK
jgi:uncharacterized protein (TIGR02598 family)